MKQPATSQHSQYAIRPWRGKPTLLCDGQPLPAVTYSYTFDVSLPGSEEIHQKFAAHGWQWYILCVRGGVDGDWSTSPYWTDDNVFPEISDAAGAEHALVRQANLTLKHCPEAMFWVRCNCSPPLRWRRKFPDNLLLNSYGHRYEEPSLASDRYNEQVGRYIENLVRFCERQPWADRIAGYLVYPLGEGTTQLTCEGYLFDGSPVMQVAFRQFLQRKYGTDTALQAAWGRPDLTLGSVTVPRDQDFMERGKTHHDKVNTDGTQVTAIPRRLHWPEPAETAAERDYCLCMRELTGRNFQTLLAAVKRVAPHKLAGIDAFKQTMLGWPLIARWVGDYQTHGGAMHPVSGAFAMAQLLDLPDLDVVATPHDYLHRGMGFGYEGEGIGDSVIAHGKMMFVEEDQRTFALTAEGGRWNPLRRGKEVAAGFWRNLGSSLSRGYNTYPMDVCGPSFFGHEEIQAVLEARRIVNEAAMGWDRQEVPSIVMVVDDASVLDEDLTIGYQYLAVILQRMYGLSRCGVPFRLHLLEDLQRDDFPTCHKVFLFPNLFRVTPERLALLKNKVFINGNIAIFGPASGISNGAVLSADSATALTGIPLELIRKESPRLVTIDRFTHPITRALGARIDFGDSYVYGPLLVPQEHPEVTRLGGIQWPLASDGAGLVIREFGRGAAGNGQPGPRGVGDFASIFSCAMPLPDVLLREFARYSGTHVYGESDDLIFADSCLLTVHAVRPGPRTIRLPAPSTVWDLIERRKLGERLTEIHFEVDPPETRLFYLGVTDPFSPHS